jgi:hypothetical protein
MAFNYKMLNSWKCSRLQFLHQSLPYLAMVVGGERASRKILIPVNL